MAKTTKTNKNDLSLFSYDYQCSILKLFIENEEFSLSTIDTMDPNHFTGSPELRKIASIIKDKTSKLNRRITYDELELYVKTTVEDTITLENCVTIIEEKLEKCRFGEAELNAIKDEYHNFLVAMETIKLGNEINERNKKGASKDEIMSLFKVYDEKTTFEEVTARPINMSDEHFESLMADDNCEVVPTGCSVLDARLGGGMRKGDFGILVAGTGIGKTCVTSGFVASAAWRGYKVAHVILEDKPDDIDAKYLGYILNQAVSTFRGKNATQEGRDSLRAKREQYKERLTEALRNNIRQISAIDSKKKIHPMTIRDIDNKLTKLESEGFYPDLVVIDYFDRIRCAVSNIEIWRKDSILSDELNELAVNHNVAMWVPSQGNKSVQDRATKINISNMSGGAWKGFTAQIVISMQKDADDMSTKNTVVQILKNRYNNDFSPIVIEFDNGTCRFGEVLNDIVPITDGEGKEVADEVYDRNKKSKKL